MNTWQNLSGEAFEEWFLNQLADCAANFDQLLAAIIHFQSAKNFDRAEACAGLLQDALLKHPADAKLLLLLEKRASWQSNQEKYAAACFDVLSSCFKGKNLPLLFLTACGLKNGVQPGEALRRLRVLCDLKPGKYCYEKTWGVGKISGIDEFDGKVVVDFEKKKSHRMALAYAGETLQLLEDGHLLALKLSDPAAFQRFLSEKPAETVKVILNHFGEMSSSRLRAVSVGLLLPEEKWNSFWSSARTGLAADPLVQMPSKRDDPIRLLSARKEFDGDWLAAFSAERDVERIFSEVEDLYAGRDPRGLEEEIKRALENRLVFAARSAGKRDHDLVVRALLLADAADIPPAQMADISRYGNAEFLLETLTGIPARNIGSFLKYLSRKKCLPSVETMADILPQMSVTVINEIVAHYSAEDARFLDLLRSAVQSGAISVAVISWLGRNLRLACEKGICRPESFAQTALSFLKTALIERDRRAINRLLAIFTDRELVREILEPMDGEHRLEFCHCLYALSGLTLAEQKKIAAKVVQAYPELASAFSDETPSSAAQVLWTSFRSYREKQAQLEKIINEEIPDNSKEIAVARSYGDLRENAEYKAAKEMQGILMRRKAELEKMLGEVKSTDFAGVQHDAAGPGDSVELKMPDGTKPVYHILGDWDSDQKLGIISCRSKLAEILKDHRAGDVVEIPGENCPVSCVLESVREPPQEIRDWINGG